MSAELLLPESLDDALIECVKAAGGSKRVASALWPAKLVDAAQRHLLNCLKEGRAEHLKPEEVLLILRMAREAGCHTGMAYLAHSLGYAVPSPVEPRDEVAQLQREFIAANAEMRARAERLEALLAAQAGTKNIRAVA
jgi:hypothetical protein